MSLLRRFSFLFLIPAVSLSFAACTDDDDDDDEGNINFTPEGPPHKHVVAQITLPKGSEDGISLDNKPGPENGLGVLLAALSKAGNGFDLQKSLNAEIQSGGVILLANLQATKLDSANKVGLSVFLGAEPDPAACTDVADPATCGKHLKGGAKFKKSASTPTDALVKGRILNGLFKGGPGSLTMQLVLNGQKVELPLIAARAELTVSDSSLEGWVAGGLTQKSIDEKVLPTVSTVINNIMKTDCTAPPECKCSGTATFLQSTFDAMGNKDCSVSVDEIKNNMLVGPLFQPDSDLEPVGKPDGTRDSLTLGVKIKTVTAEFPD